MNAEGLGSGMDLDFLEAIPFGRPEDAASTPRLRAGSLTNAAQGCNMRGFYLEQAPPHKQIGFLAPGERDWWPQKRNLGRLGVWTADG